MTTQNFRIFYRISY